MASHSQVKPHPQVTLQKMISHLSQLGLAVSMVGWGSIALFPSAAQAHDFTNLSRLAGDLFYPRASERFFLEGRQQLEQEIQRQRQPKPPAALQVQPEVPPTLKPEPLPEELKSLPSNPPP
ncbi:MAG: hypothetical protein VKJ24_13135 [Synechococcales bacterium]|nr:hypothetical protein [Synechococcales bacterium]